MTARARTGSRRRAAPTGAAPAGKAAQGSPQGARAEVSEVRIGSRILRVGDVVNVTGFGSATFEVFGFRVEGGEVTCARVFGGRAGHHHWRYFTLDRIGARKRVRREEVA